MTVKFHYYPETDSLYIDLSEKTSVDWKQRCYPSSRFPLWGHVPDDMSVVRFHTE